MLAWILAQPAESGGDATNWTEIGQYGVLGLIVLAFIFGKIVPGYVYERRVAEHQAAVAENKRLEDTIKERVIPALIKSTDVMVQVLDMLNTLDPPPPPPRTRRST